MGREGESRDLLDDARLLAWNIHAAAAPFPQQHLSPWCWVVDMPLCQCLHVWRSCAFTACPTFQTHLSPTHTLLTSSVNVLVCLKSNTCYTTSFTCSCVKCTRTHIHTRPRKQQRVNWRSLLNPWTFYFLVSSLFQPSSWKSGIFCYHDNRSWWRQWIRSSALCWGCGSCIGSGVEDCSWGVWLLKGIGVMLECCMCVFSVCMCVCGY